MTKRKSEVVDYPRHLHSPPTNKYGGSKLQRERNSKGWSKGPAGPVRIFSLEERDKYAQNSLYHATQPSKSQNEEWHDEQTFKSHVVRKLSEASRITGGSFQSALRKIKEVGAVAFARRLIGDIKNFQYGILQMQAGNCLDCSIEQAVIDYYLKGMIFNCDDAQKARIRLNTINGRGTRQKARIVKRRA